MILWFSHLLLFFSVVKPACGISFVCPNAVYNLSSSVFFFFYIKLKRIKLWYDLTFSGFYLFWPEPHGSDVPDPSFQHDHLYLWALTWCVGWRCPGNFWVILLWRFASNPIACPGFFGLYLAYGACLGTSTTGIVLSSCWTNDMLKKKNQQKSK